MKTEALLFRWRAALLSERGPASAVRRYVLLTLSIDADMDGRNCFPSTRRLAERTGLSQRRVEGHLRAADTEGWIGRTRSGQGQGWRRTLYTLRVPDVRTECPHLGHEGGDGAIVGTERLHLEMERGDAVAERADAGGTNVRTERPLTSPSTSPKTSVLCDESHDGLERHDNFPSLAKLPRAGRNRIYPPEFEGAFAAMPPRHVTHPKVAAYQAWRIRAREAQEAFQLEAAALAYAEQMEADGDLGTKFVKMASSFFGPGQEWESFSGIAPPRPAASPRPAPGGGFYAA